MAKVLSDYIVRARRRLARSIEPRQQPDRPPVIAYYDQQLTCQIPHLWFLLEHFLGARGNGQYVEVGAYDGLFASNTWGLARVGWSGLLVKPVPAHVESIRRNYSGFPGIQVVSSALGAEPGEMTLFLGGPLTTANTELLAKYSSLEWATPSLTKCEITVEVTTLDRILERHKVPQGFDLLVVDVEGQESEVFNGFDLKWWRPKILIVELADTHPDLVSSASKDAALGRRIVDSGYSVVYKDHINTVFVREDVVTSAQDSNQHDFSAPQDFEEGE